MPRLNPDDRRSGIKLTRETVWFPLNPPPRLQRLPPPPPSLDPARSYSRSLREYDGQLAACFAVDQMKTRRNR